MGFSIGKFIQVAAPIVGAIVGGRAGFAIGSAVSAGFRGDPAPAPGPVPGRAVTPQFSAPPPVFRATQISPSPFGQRINGFGVTRRRAGTFGGLAAGALLGTAMELFDGNGCPPRTELQLILAEARANVRGATKRKIIAAAKACGIDVAAETFGLDMRQICLVIVAGAGRRRRGISSADIRRTKRTLNFVKRIRKDLKAIKA